MKSFRLYLPFILIAVMPAMIIAQSKPDKAASTPITQIKYQGKTVALSERALYVNAKLKKTDYGPYVFGTLQELAAKAKDGTEENPTVVYLEPDVYWTDDPAGSNSENHLIGLVLPQEYMTMIGLSEDPDHTIIAGNRGQMAGSRGNWNTLAIGNSFHASNITFGNYCNLDLVYALDPSKNHSKRQSTITQAQVITKANTGELDKWLFDNCRFISFLNVFARTNEPHRTFYNNCFFQCTDDAIGTGDISVYQDCDFKYYANHPSAIGSNIVQVYLGCRFDGVLRDANANATVFFAKRNSAFPTIDAVFTGNIKKLEWTDNLNDDVRQYVYNNSLHGKPVAISASRPELSVSLNRESLKAFKVDKEYNIYNLLRGDDDWDPAGQKTRLAKYADLPYRLQLLADNTKLNVNESATVSYTIYPARVRSSTPVKWSVSDKITLVLKDNGNGTATVTGYNNTEAIRKAYVKAETGTGIVAVTYIEVLPKPLPAPSFTKKIRIAEPANGAISADYALNLGKRADNSLITWYRSTQPDGSDTIQAAVTRLNEPLKIYPLTPGDIGYYLVATIEPRHTLSLPGSLAMAVSRKITAKDITSKNIHTNFRNVPVKRSATIRDGWWTLDSYHPADLGSEFNWTPGAGDTWVYGTGEGGGSGRYGLMTTGRGARLLYARAGVSGDMAVTLNLSPHKESGQGFGSATGQFADIYIKMDVKTLTGYGLRIERTPAHGEGVKFTLYKFTNGVGTPISKDVYSSAFMPGCTVKLTATGATLTAKVTTTTPQQQIQKDNGLASGVNLSATIEQNTFGGTGVQHTGTVSSGNRLMLEDLTIKY